MSFHVFFSMSTGLSKPIQVPKGTLKLILEEISEVEAVLGIKRMKVGNTDREAWNTFDAEYRNGFPSVSDEVLCKTASDHNKFVMRKYNEFAHWSEYPFPPPHGKRDHQAEHHFDRSHPSSLGFEIITPEQSEDFWCGLRFIDVPVERWTIDYYRERMDHLYNVMRGVESEGVSFDVKPLTTKQAAMVINLFSEFLDKHDLRLDVPHGRDYLASSYDGGYTWCDKCFRPIAEDDLSCRRKKCPLRSEEED